MSQRILLSEQIYRWLVADELIPPSGQLTDKGLLQLPHDVLQQLQNGVVVAAAMRSIMNKSGQNAPAHLQSVTNHLSKQTKSANWNFIWLSFEELKVQFDQRIRDLILQGEHSLIPEILKQLFDRDENRDERGMRNVKVEKRISQAKASNAVRSTTLDIKKINPKKDPSESESSLELLILLLGQSFDMAIEEILGLFTNQNKYLAHLLVKGVNETFQGVQLFYGLLLKHSDKFKQFTSGDPRDAESLLYAIKPGLISKDQRVAELAIQVFGTVSNVYFWLVSETSRGASTLLLGVRRHPQLAHEFWNLLLQLVQNHEEDFFLTHFKRCFRDAEEMVEICGSILEPLSQSILKQELSAWGALQDWVEIGGRLADEGTLHQQILAFRFLGQVLDHLPQIIQENEEYLQPLRKGWRQRKLGEFALLFQSLLEILQLLAGDRNTMARRVYQIIIQVMEAIFDNDEKREILVRGFITVLPKFPRIPSQFLIDVYKEGTLKTSDFEFVRAAVTLTQDQNCRIRIAETCLSLFNSQPALNQFLAPIIYHICRNLISQQPGRQLTSRVIKQCLAMYSQIEGSQKLASVAKHQPMYFVQKGNERYKKEEEQEFLIGEQKTKNLLELVEKLIDMIKKENLDGLIRYAKQELMQTNAVIKKGHYKANITAIAHLLNKKFGVSRQQMEEFNQEFRVKKSLASMEESMARRHMTNSAGAMPLSSSRFGGPAHLRKNFDEVTEKRRKEEEERQKQEQRREREDALKKLQVRKQLQKTNLLRGFMQEAELKQDGFWSRFNKDRPQELQLYPPELMQQRDVDFMQNSLHHYHRLMRSLFFKYTSSKYTTQSHANTKFEDNTKRNESLHIVELIQMLKDFKLFFLTSKEEVTNLVRDLNVKMLKKRETQNLDFQGFEQFVIQFCAVVFTKVHTINANTNNGTQVIKKNYNHLSHLQLLEEWFNYLKLIFIERGEKTTLFDEPETAYFNETEVVKEFTKKLQEDPTFILPEGYKKVTEKVMTLAPEYSDKNSGISQTYLDVYQVLDEILFESQLRLHLLEPLVQKQTKLRVKPQAFMNIKTKLLDATEAKPRAFSSIIEKKPVIPPVKMLQRKVLTLGMKLGLSYVSYKDKLLGQQVAYVLDDMLSAVESGRQSIEKQKVINDYLKSRQDQIEKEKFMEMDKEKKRLQRKNQLERMKKEILEKRQKEKQQNKGERQASKQKKVSRQKKIRQQKEKYLSDQKSKLQQKKKKDEQEAKLKKTEDKKKNRQSRKKKQTQFKQFNDKQIEKFKKELETEAEKKKMEKQKQEQDVKRKQQLVQRLRNKIHQSDKKAIQVKQKTNEEINELYSSQPIQEVFQFFEASVRALFDFLLKSTFHSITKKKVNSEITSDTWQWFGFVFQLNPFIIKGRQLMKIFIHYTRDKQIHRDYETGMNFEEFKQALLRVAIKHKSIFNKLSEKIKESMTTSQISEVVQKDIEEKQKNQFQESKPINVKHLMEEQEIKKSAIQHYGDISKVNPQTLKALLYYLKVPRDKAGQDKRFRDVLASKVSYSVSNVQQLREKLNTQYTLSSPVKRSTERQDSLVKQSSPPKEESPVAQ